MTPEDRALVNLAIGRIFRMGSRPEQPGDVADYEECRRIVLDHIEPREDYRTNYARDRLKGAAGD